MKFETFKKWLGDKGAEILVPTNEYEILRFRSNDKVSVIYQGKRGFTFTGESERAYDAFIKGKAWTAGNGIKRKQTVEIRSLLDRDGDACFYCLETMLPSEMTREHLLPLIHGGNNHIANQVLTHFRCNLEAGVLSIREKMAIREKNLLARQVVIKKDNGFVGILKSGGGILWKKFPLFSNAK